MIVVYQKVFEGGLSGLTAAYSLPQFDVALARAVRWYVTARATQVTGTTPKIVVTLQHSNSGMPSEFKNLGTVGQPINGTALAPNVINIIEGSLRHTDAGISVPGAFVRAELSLSGAADNNANVELWITGRDDR